MSNISLRQYALFLGSNTVIGMARKVRLTPPPPPISVRNVVSLAGGIILPLGPVALQPQDGAQNISHDPYLFFRDPGEGTPAAALQFVFNVAGPNGILIGPSNDVARCPLAPPGVKYGVSLPSGKCTLHVWGENRAGNGPTSYATFTVEVLAPPPPPPPVQPYSVPLYWKPGTPMYVQSDPVYAAPTSKVLKVGNKNPYGHRCDLLFPNGHLLKDQAEAKPADLGLADQMLGMVITATPGAPLDGQQGQWDVWVELTYTT
jgi:hypothetical protein